MSRFFKFTTVSIFLYLCFIYPASYVHAACQVIVSPNPAAISDNLTVTATDADRETISNNPDHLSCKIQSCTAVKAVTDKDKGIITCNISSASCNLSPGSHTVGIFYSSGPVTQPVPDCTTPVEFTAPSGAPPPPPAGTSGTITLTAKDIGEGIVSVSGIYNPSTGNKSGMHVTIAATTWNSTKVVTTANDGSFTAIIGPFDTGTYTITAQLTDLSAINGQTEVTVTSSVSPTPCTSNCTTAGGKTCSNDTGIITAIGCIPTEPTALVQGFLTFATGIGGAIALLLMISGAFQMIASQGNPETVKKGQEQFTSAVIGLLFIIFSVLLLQVIGFDILQIPGLSK